MPEHEFVNGLDVTRLKETIHAVKENSDAAQFQLRVHNAWVDGSHAFSIIDSFSAGGHEDCHATPTVLHCDEPDALLGTDYGPNPAETVLHALASCVGSATLFNAAAQGVHIDQLEFEVEGDIDIRGFLGVDEETRRGFKTIRMHCTISGDAPKSKLRELVELGQKYSPVFDIVSHGVPVNVIMEEEDIEAAV
jgi:uncharacterized OsmC-like protein